MHVLTQNNEVTGDGPLQAKTKPTLSFVSVSECMHEWKGHIATTSAEKELAWSQVVSLSQAMLAFVPPHLSLLLAVHIAVEAYA